MNTGIFTTKQSFFVALLLAGLLALTASVGSMALDQVAGTQLTQSAAACHTSSGGC